MAALKRRAGLHGVKGVDDVAVGAALLGSQRRCFLAGLVDCSLTRRPEHRECSRRN